MVSAMEQLRSFLISIGTGLAIGLLYDLVWLFRSRLHWKRIGTGLGDILFWVVTTGLAFVLLLLANNGELRIFVYLGMGLGLIGYFGLFSNYLRRLISAGTSLLIRILVSVWLALLWPIRLIIKVLLFPVNLLGRFKHAVIEPRWKRVNQGISRKVRRLCQGILGRAKGFFRRRHPPED